MKQDFLKTFLEGDRRSLARIITLVENEAPETPEIMGKIYSRMGKAYRIGITGPPGAGKSTLVNVFARELRNRGKTVAIVAVDPTSPFSGGALLGDRIRMSSALTDPHIYMRSMASRGASGGLARTTTQVADVIDAFGFDVIVIETVGVGQLELDVAGLVDTTVVVLVPEAGGGIQAMKAGLIEIADVFAINKADRPGAEHLKHELEEALNLLPALKDAIWELPIKLTVALENQGISELADTVFGHERHLRENDLFEKNRIAQKRSKIIDVIKQRMEQNLLNCREMAPMLERLSRLCAGGSIDPFKSAGAFMSSLRARNKL